MLLPFDGTVCDLFAGMDTAVIAERIRARLSDRGHRMSLLTSIVTDPLEMLAYAHHTGLAYGTEAEEIVRNAEIAAATTATPTPGMHKVLQACQASGRRVVVVGDTCHAAMETYLDAHGLRHLAGPVIGREQRWPSSKEPPGVALIRQAVKTLGAKPSDCTLVSLSPQDMFTAEDAGTQAIGVVSKHAKRKHLAVTGGSAVVSSLPQLAGALTAVPPAEAYGAPPEQLQPPTHPYEG
ncbi:HAD hydrolase-like protein [Streptosporangium sp. NPDC023963]|uniref:HAD family hydrolase n=1 Tax=Streptosporangium sp. NPDC023963 TaxID=3155608 RepID=UPI0034303BCA